MSSLRPYSFLLLVIYTVMWQPTTFAKQKERVPPVREGHFQWWQKGPEKIVRFSQATTNKELEAFSTWKDVTSFKMGGMNSGAAGPFVTDDGLRHIQDWDQLKELGLSWLPITDEGMRYISGLSSLRTLQLDSTKVTAL